MKHSRRLLVLVAGTSVSAILALVGWRVVLAPTSPSNPRAAAAASIEQSDTRSVPSRTAEAAPLERRSLSTAVRENSMGDNELSDIDSVAGAAPSEADPGERQDPGKERPRVTLEEAIGHVQTDFFRQSPDRGWTREMADKAEEILNTEQAGAAIQSVDCRESTCRIEVLYANEEQYRQGMDSASSLSDSEKAVTRGPERPDQQWSMLIYLARHGADLPKIN